MAASSGPPSTEEVIDYAVKKGVSRETLGLECTETHFLELASRMTGWTEVAPYMLENSDVEEIKRESCLEKEKKLSMLRRWRQHLAFKATFRELIMVFVKAKRADLAQLVCDILGDSKGEPVDDSSVPAQVTASENDVTGASRKADFFLTTPPQSPTEVKPMPPDDPTDTTDASETSFLLKGSVQPAAASSGVTSAEQTVNSAGQSTMVISTPPANYWPNEVKDKLAVVCDPNAGLPEHYRTELVKLGRRVERLELERAHKDDEHSADIKSYKIKCENMMKQKNLLERQLSQSEQSEKHLEKVLHESKKSETTLRENNETLVKRLTSANEKIFEYERKIEEISNERDRALQQYDDLFRKENELFLKTVSESLENVQDPRHEADLKWLQTTVAVTMDRSRSCPSFKSLNV